MYSLFSLKRIAYESAPEALRSFVNLLPFHIVAGSAYRAVMREGPTVDGLPRERVLELMEARLGSILTFAVRHVPFYKIFRRRVEELRPSEALQEFPLIDKDTVLNHFSDFVADRDARKRHYQATTGGTSGRQLKVLLEDSSQPVEMAFMHRQWRRVGHWPQSRTATFRGVYFPRASQGVYWQLNPVYREMQFSPMAMSEANLAEYWRKLKEYSPDFLLGYPSAIALLARFVLRNSYSGDGLTIKSALLGSESCTAEQRSLIEQAFCTRVFTWYGHTERLILGGECERSSAYHQFPDYGWLEILDGSNRSAEIGDRGELVGTGFLNRVMPLIRYRTGDYATRLVSSCACGRHWDRFASVEGRWNQDVIIGHSGAPVSLAALNLHGPHFDRVIRYQYFQDTIGVCEIRVMADPGFSDSDRLAIEAAYKRKVGSDITFAVRVVSDIPLTSRGKLKLLDSRLNTAAPAISSDSHKP